MTASKLCIMCRRPKGTARRFHADICERCSGDLGREPDRPPPPEKHEDTKP